MHFSNTITLATMALGAAAQTITAPPLTPTSSTLQLPTWTFCADSVGAGDSDDAPCVNWETWAPTTVTCETTSRCAEGGQTYSGLTYPCMSWSTPTPCTLTKPTEVKWFKVEPTTTAVVIDKYYSSIPQWASLATTLETTTKLN